MLAPHLLVLAVVVQHGHLALGHTREHGAGALLGVVLALVIEEPGHLQPLGLGVHGGQALIDVLRDLVQVLGLEAGWIHLVKRVDAVDVVGAEQPCLFLEEQTLDAAVQRVLAVEKVRAVLLIKARPTSQGLDVRLGEQVPQRPGNVPRKGRQHGTHVQRALPFHDALLQRRLALKPLLGQRAAPAVDVGHAVPRQVGRPGEIVAHLLVGHAQPGPHVIPHRFLPRDGQRQVHAVQRHPVDEAFPVPPLPKRHRVAPRAVVEEETLWHACRHPLGGGHVGQGLGQFNGHVGIPRHRHLAIAVQVAVQSHRHRARVIAPDGDLAAPALKRENVTPLFGIDLMELHLSRQHGRQTACQGLGLPHVVTQL